jgi:hypothetical protein
MDEITFLVLWPVWVYQRIPLVSRWYDRFDLGDQVLIGFITSMILYVSLIAWLLS